MLRPALPHSKRARMALGLGLILGSILIVSLIARDPTVQTLATPNAEPMAGVVIPTAPATPEAAAVAADGKSQLILELFNPSDASLTDQVTTTTLTQQIEQALTVSYVLTKCQLFSQDDYANTFRALVIYAERMKLAPNATVAEAVVRRIAESAGASYSLIYSRTSCRDAQLPPLAFQLSSWTKSIIDPSP